jgi:hypothetical protein
MSGCEIATFITTKDFQEYWQWVDERTSSSFSGANLLHYKAASFHYMLLAMNKLAHDEAFLLHDGELGSLCF